MQLDDGFDNIVVVDGIPVIDKSKQEKLLARVGKEFSRKGAPISIDNIFVPWDDQINKSKGQVSAFDTALHYSHHCFSFIFVEFKTRDEAEYAINAMNGHPFDAKHTFRLNHFTDIEKYYDMDETYVEPKVEEYKSSVSANRSHIIVCAHAVPGTPSCLAG